MTSAELETFLNEDAAETAEARTLANIARRAETLFTTDGYRVMNRAADVFFIATPKGDCYAVELDNPFTDKPNCTCPCFAKRKTCKHFLAVLSLVWEEEHALDVRLETEAQAAEACREFYAEAAEHYYHPHH